MSFIRELKGRNVFCAAAALRIVAWLVISSRMCRISMGVVVLGSLAFGGRSAGAQESDIAKLSSWIALDAPTGHESLATGPLSGELDGWRIDAASSPAASIGTLMP
jgi:hypothetical protein